MAQVRDLLGLGRVEQDGPTTAGQLRDELCVRAESIAADIEGTIPVFYGADLTAPVAYRWKCEVNENAKLPAFSSRLPEASHNEISGW